MLEKRKKLFIYDNVGPVLLLRTGEGGGKNVMRNSVGKMNLLCWDNGKSLNYCV